MAPVNKERAMNKFKAYIKRPVNFNFVSVLAVAAFLVFLLLVCLAIYIGSEAELNEMSARLDEIRSQEEIDDVEGYGLIVESIGYGLGVLGNALLLGLGVIVPGIISAVIAVFAVTARLIYSDTNKNRLLAYRIVSGFGYFFMLAFCLMYSTVFLLIDVATAIPAAIFDILVIAVFIIGIRNTYSEKILKGAANEIEI